MTAPAPAAGGGAPWRGRAAGDMAVTRCPLAMARSEGPIGRAVQGISFALASAPTLLGRAAGFRPDLVAAMAPSAAAASAVLGAARLADAPAWLHLDEAFPMPAAGLRRRFDRVSLAALDAEARLAAAGVAPTRRLALPPWVDTRAILPQEPPGRLHAALRFEPGAVVALYVGSLAEPRRVDTLIEAARRVPPAGAIRFVICGAGPARPRLAAAAAEIAPLHLLSWPAPVGLDDLLGLADLHLMPGGVAEPDPLVPAKVAALLASGRPIVAGGDPAALPPALGSAVSIVAAEDGEALAAGVVALAAAPEPCRGRGAAARRTAQDYYERERVLRRLERDLLGLAAPLATPA